MFSLIITIIAIALVAALALATIYYGGSAFNKGASSANAAKLMNQSQQILGADRLYRVDHEGAMPPSMQALVDGGYLKSIPVAQTNEFTAVAASTTWAMVASPSGRAYTFSSDSVDANSCKEVNSMAFGQNGIPNKVFTGFKTQCYGPDLTHLTVLVVADPDALGSSGSTNTELPNAPTVVAGSSPSSSDWTSVPETPGSGGAGEGGAGTALNALSPNMTSINFGGIATGSTAPAVTLNVTNTADIAATLSVSASGGFTVVSTSCSSGLDATSVCQINVSLASTGTAGTYSGVLTIGATGAGGQAYSTLNIPLSATVGPASQVYSGKVVVMQVAGSRSQVYGWAPFDAVTSADPFDWTKADGPNDAARKAVGITIDSVCALGNYQSSAYNSYTDYDAYIVMYPYKKPASAGCDWASEMRVHVRAYP